MRIQIPYDTFWRLSPVEFDIIFEGYVEAQKRQNQMNWINGMYTLSALQSVLGTMFGKKGSHPIQYMKEPLPIYEKKEKELTKEEKVAEEQKLLLFLESMQKSFEQNKK